eukprot:scaffold9045_cov53-Phaeocystis_antarctica.AAC.5
MAEGAAHMASCIRCCSAKTALAPPKSPSLARATPSRASVESASAGPAPPGGAAPPLPPSHR